MTARITKGDGGADFRDLPALLDTGADITLIPRHAIEALGLQLVTDDLELHDGTGRVSENEKMYRADIKIDGLPLHTVGVASTGAAIIFVGLDILNDYIATFHGPRQAVTLD